MANLFVMSSGLVEVRLASHILSARPGGTRRELAHCWLCSSTGRFPCACLRSICSLAVIRIGLNPVAVSQRSNRMRLRLVMPDMSEIQRGLAPILMELPDRFGDEPPTLGRLLSVLGEQATALVLLVFSIPAIIPTPGIPAGMVFGTALALLSLQLVIGAERFLLPGKLAHVTVPKSLLKAMAVRLGPKLAWLETWLKPRGRVLSGRLALRPLGLVILVMSVLIALPIPFGNVLPGLAIFFIALGLAQRDGMAVAGGLVFGFAALAFTAFLFLGGWWLLSDWLGWNS